MPDITREEADAVARFIEAARELRESPFFGEDEPKTGWSVDPGSKGGVADITVGSSQVLTQMLLPFRRIWMKKEPSNFYKICNILRRHNPSPDMQSFIDSIRADHGRCSKQWPTSTDSMECRQTPEDFVNSYLNNLIAHSEKDESKANQFAELRDEIGHSKAEALFRIALQAIGCCYINVLPVAEGALKFWAEKKNVTPSQAVRKSMSRDGVQVNADGTTITRGSATPETVEQTTTRLLARDSMSHLALLLKYLSLRGVNRVDVLMGAETIRSVIEMSGYSVQELPWNRRSSDMPKVRTIWCDPQLRRTGKGWSVRKGWMVASERKEILLGGDALLLLEDELQTFKKQMGLEGGQEFGGDDP